ncbi:MAG: ATP-binding protein [bacterium]
MTFVVILAVSLLWIDYRQIPLTWLVLYGLLTLSVTLRVGLDRRRRWQWLTALLMAGQFASEVVAESSIILWGSVSNTTFVALFILTIVSASMAYRLVGTLLVASLVSLSYAVVIWLGGAVVQPPLSPDPLESVLSVGDSAFYPVFLHILIFYLIAFISGYLADHLRQRDRQLADTSRALRRAQLETDDILRHLNSGLLTVDARGQLIFFNRAAEQILGYREFDVRGMHCRDVFGERMPDLAEVLLDGLERQKPYPRLELQIRSLAHQIVPLGLSTSCLTDSAGSLRGVIAIFSDLTEAKHLEAKVRTADRLAAVGELSASIAHEIRNPLAAISGSVQLLKQELGVDGANERLMDLILKESDRLSKITTDFLQYARVSEPLMTKVELCHLVNEVVQLLRHHAGCHHQIETRLESTADIVYAVCDADLLKQLLINLAVNAVEAIGDNPGRITFALDNRENPHQVRLEVSDNGPGMPVTNLKRIYQPFYSTKKQGTGLGLAIVHRLAQSLRIDLQVASEVGVGTSFILLIQSFDGRGCQRTSDPDSRALTASR